MNDDVDKNVWGKPIIEDTETNSKDSWDDIVDILEDKFGDTLPEIVDEIISNALDS
jgi:hypothetical protein